MIREYAHPPPRREDLSICSYKMGNLASYSNVCELWRRGAANFKEVEERTNEYLLSKKADVYMLQSVREEEPFLNALRERDYRIYVEVDTSKKGIFDHVIAVQKSRFESDPVDSLFLPGVSVLALADKLTGVTALFASVDCLTANSTAIEKVIPRLKEMNISNNGSVLITHAILQSFDDQRELHQSYTAVVRTWLFKHADCIFAKTQKVASLHSRINRLFHTVFTFDEIVEFPFHLGVNPEENISEHPAIFSILHAQEHKSYCVSLQQRLTNLFYYWFGYQQAVSN